MDVDDLIYMIGELYAQRREQQVENSKLKDEIVKKDERIVDLLKQLDSSHGRNTTT